MKLFHTILLTLCLSLGTSVAMGGPLLDRLKERRSVQSEEEAMAQPDTAEQATLPQGVRVLRDVAYGAHAKQRMDVYLPTSKATNSGSDAAQNAPVILMVHGGGWRHGDKALGSVVENKVARWVQRGFVLVSVNNRLLPEADPLIQAGDVALALARAQHMAPGWGADPARFVLMGHSAGAHLVALLTASPMLAAQSGAMPWLGTVELDSAAMDVERIMQAHHFRLYDPAFGKDPVYWRSVSPTQRLDGSAKPMLLVCSSRRDASCEQAHGYALKAAALHVPARVLVLDLSHRDINQKLGMPGSYTETVESFMGSLDPSLAQRLSVR